MIEIELPASKSIGARFLVASYFAGTLPADPYFEDNDDLIVIQQALLSIYSDEEPIDYGNSPIDVHASGTALRLVTAVCASSPGADYVITGTPRLCERPMSPLIRVLRQAGANIVCMGKNETGPYRITGDRLKGGEFEIEGNISSQFISALMMTAPSWEKGMKLNFTTPLVSRPYLEMTADVMKQFGISVDLTDQYVKIDSGKYVEPEGFKVEADWSSASFFYEACSLGGGEITLPGLKEPVWSLQGDAAVCNIYADLGVISSFSKSGVEIKADVSETIKDIFEYDFKNCPDLLLPVAVTCLLKGIKFRFNGVANLRLKESDRIESLVLEAKKLGFVITSEEDRIAWEGNKIDAGNDPIIETHEDHRVAMAFAMVALSTGEIRIANPKVVEKSFAQFWQELEKLPLKIVGENDDCYKIVKL